MRILLSTLAACALMTGAASAQTPPLAGGAEPAAPEGGAWADCTVIGVGVYRDRFELKCAGAASADNPRVFAIEMMDRMTDPVLRMGLEAKARGKPLAVLYVKATIANPAGCPPETCRRIVGVESK